MAAAAAVRALVTAGRHVSSLPTVWSNVLAGTVIAGGAALTRAPVSSSWP